MEFRFSPSQPYDWRRLLAYLKPRAIPWVERISSNRYFRSVKIKNHAACLDVRFSDGRVTARMTMDGILRENMLQRSCQRRALERMFMPAGIPCGAMKVLCSDARLRPLVSALPGLLIPQAWDGFELLVRAIAGQQVTVKGATTLVGRLVQRFGRELDVMGGDIRLFPDSVDLATGDFSGLGFTTRRIETIKRLSSEASSGNIDLCSDSERLAAELMRLPGIGDWTVQYFLLRARADLDAFPASDLGLLRAAESLGIADSYRSLRHAAERWRPYRGVAAMYLWHALTPRTPSDKLSVP